MNRFHKFAVNLCYWYLALSTITTICEWKIIPIESRAIYFPVKIALFLIAIPVVVVIRKDFHNKLAIAAFGLSMVGYAFWGEIYRAFYSHVFFIAIFLYALVFPVNRAGFLLVTGTGTLLFAGYYAFFWDHFSQNLPRIAQSDMIMIVFETVTLAIFAFNFLSSERQLKNQANERFSLIGKQTASLIHDLKNMMNSPQILLQEMKANPSARTNEENLVILQLIESDLARCVDHLKTLNHLAKAETAKANWYPVAESIQRARFLLGKKGTLLELTTEGNCEIFETAETFETIFFNLIQNTIQQLERLPGSARISIRILNSQIIYEDEAGGYAAELLQRLEKSDFTAANGLGLYFVNDLIQGLGGKAQFENSEKGARISLWIPKKKMRTLENSIVA